MKPSKALPYVLSAVIAASPLYARPKITVNGGVGVNINSEKEQNNELKEKYPDSKSLETISYSAFAELGLRTSLLDIALGYNHGFGKGTAMVIDGDTQGYMTVQYSQIYSALRAWLKLKDRISIGGNIKPGLEMANRLQDLYDQDDKEENVKKFSLPLGASVRTGLLVTDINYDVMKKEGKITFGIGAEF